MNKQISVLIVEDNDSYRMELEMILEEHDYLIWCSTASAAEALKKLDAGSDRPDIILLDVRLKENVDGIGFAELLSANKIPVIFLTAYPDEHQFRQALKTAPAAYLLKPVKPIELHHAIQVALISDSPAVPKTTDDKARITNDTLILKAKNNLPHPVPIVSIYAVVSQGNFVFFHTISPENRFSLKITLTEMEEKLQGYGFIRIHRKYLISVAHWKKKLPLGSQITVANRKFPIGRTYRKNLLPHLELLK